MIGFFWFINHRSVELVAKYGGATKTTRTKNKLIQQKRTKESEDVIKPVQRESKDDENMLGSLDVDAADAVRESQRKEVDEVMASVQGPQSGKVSRSNR